MEYITHKNYTKRQSKPIQKYEMVILHQQMCHICITCVFLVYYTCNTYMYNTCMEYLEYMFHM